VSYSYGVDNTISVGDGEADAVTMGFGSNNHIILGNGADDEVNNNGRTPGGNNTITLGNGAGDVVNDAGSNETITVGNGADTVAMGENSTITVGNGADTVTAGADSTITLGNGADTVTTISSLINGGHGHDRFVFTGSFGLDTITNFSAAHDSIVLAQAMFANFGAVESHMMQVGANTVITYDPANVITLTNVKASSLHASDFQFV
jgi:hypothetical protein